MFALAFHPVRLGTNVTQTFRDFIYDRRYVPVVVAGTYDEIIGDVDQRSDIQDDDVFTLLGRRGLGRETSFLQRIAQVLITLSCLDSPCR